MLFLLALLSPFTLVRGQASLIPPSTFGTVTAPPSTSTATNPSSSASFNSTTSGTPTSTAQFPSLSGYSSCVSNCLSLGVASSNCTSVVEVDCFCPSSSFTETLVTCVSAACTSDLPAAESLARQFCALASPNASLSFPPAPSTSSSPLTSSLPSSTRSAATTSAAETQTTDQTSTNGALRNRRMFSGTVSVIDYSLLGGLALAGLAVHFG